MAQVVGGFLLPHDPLMAAKPTAPAPATLTSITASFDRVIDRLRDLRADTIVTIGDDHYAMFGPHCIPQCLIAIGDVDGPLESWLGIERAPLPINEGSAKHILTTGLNGGIAWSFAKSIVVDHSTVVPYRLWYEKALPNVNLVPIYLNAGVEPFIPSRMAQRIGVSMREAIESWPGNERVVIAGTGGCSHFVGNAAMGTVSERFDALMIDLIARGDIEGLIALDDAEVLRDGGNGAVELKNWITAMAATGGAASLIGYESVPEWISGIPFAELAATAPVTQSARS